MTKKSDEEIHREAIEKIEAKVERFEKLTDAIYELMQGQLHLTGGNGLAAERAVNRADKLIGEVYAAESPDVLSDQWSLAEHMLNGIAIQERRIIMTMAGILRGQIKIDKDFEDDDQEVE